MLFYAQSAEGAASGDQLGQITLPQFRGLMTSSKAVTSRLSPERVDEIFTSVATSPQTLARKADSKNGVSTFDLLDFMIAIVHVAHARFAAENPQQVRGRRRRTRRTRRRRLIAPPLAPTPMVVAVMLMRPQANVQLLSFKLMTLFKETLSLHTFPELTKKLTKFDQAVNNSAAGILLKRGRR